MLCNQEEEVICGQGNQYNNYYCFFNKVDIELQNTHTVPKFSVLLIYQIRTLRELWLREFRAFMGKLERFEERSQSDHLLMFHDIPDAEMIWSHRYTIWTYHGQGVQLKFFAINFAKEDRVSVAIFDGPVKVISRLIYEYTHSSNNFYSVYRYKGGFCVTYVLEHLASLHSEGQARMMYEKYKYDFEYYHINSMNDIKTLSINTHHKSENKVLYYRYISVRTEANSFIQLNLTKLRSLSGASNNCEYGGFALSEAQSYHYTVIGPYCTQSGTEPLVNNITTFQSSRHYLTLFVYSFTFELLIDLTFQQTECEGITNICNRFCVSDGQILHPPVNYRETHSVLESITCLVAVIIRERCVIVQKTPIYSKFKCHVQFFAYKGIFNVSYQTLNNIK